jgi:hypothetical protein
LPTEKYIERSLKKWNYFKMISATLFG